MEMNSTGFEKRGVKRPAENSQPDYGSCTIQKCINCKVESDMFVPVVCSHVFCTQCYNRLFADLEPGAQARCPEDGRVLVPDYGVISSASGGDVELVPKVRMPCTNKERGCDKMVFFHDMELHLNSCVHRLLPSCPQGCNEKVVYKDLVTHLTLSCDCRLVKCQYCQDDVALNVIEKHEIQCPLKPVACPHCNMENILQKELHFHIETCPMSPGMCIMREMGCTYEGPKKDIEVHQKSWQYHIDVLVKCISSLQGQVNDLSSRIEELQHNGVPPTQANSPRISQEMPQEDSSDTNLFEEEEEVDVEVTEDIQEDGVLCNGKTTPHVDAVSLGDSSSADNKPEDAQQPLSVDQLKDIIQATQPVHVPVVGSSTTSPRRLRSHARSKLSTQKESPRESPVLASPTKPQVTETCSISAVDWSAILDLDFTSIKEEPPTSSTEKDTSQSADRDDDDDGIEIVYVGSSTTSSSWRCPTCLNRNGATVNFCKLCMTRKTN